MNFKLLLRVTAPAIGIGLLLFATCLASIRYIKRLQTNLVNILSDNVTSLQAAQELEIRVRQLRFHSVLYLMDPRPERLKPIEADQEHFEEALEVVRQTADTPEEEDCFRRIEEAYQDYQREQVHLRETAGRGRSGGEFAALLDSHPVRRVVQPCQELLRVNRERMEETALESQHVSEQANRAMLLLGLAGPVGGLIMGYGVARALRRSICRLSVRVQDMARHLDQKVASVSVVADGDIHHLDQQMQVIVQKVEEVAERLQQHQRELLRAEQLSALGQLAAGVAHEVRNPVTGIKMLVEAAVRPENPRPLGREDLRVIQREVARLEQTVQGFLNFARLPAPQQAPCDLRDVIHQALELVRVRAEQQHVAIRVEAPDRPVVASVDRGQLGMVLVNLLLNALDAMPQGGRLAVTLEQPRAGQLRLRVADTGTGIPPQIADRLFTYFATTKPTGTGLGLSLSRRIIEEHGGAITAQNQREGGACFTISLPAAPAEAVHENTARR
jgi:two-component system, NtrC family, sensor histidine kinase HydH